MLCTSAAFDCRRDALNHWFRRHAWRNQQTELLRTHVVCDSTDGGIAGCVGLPTAPVRNGLGAPAKRGSWR